MSGILGNLLNNVVADGNLSPAAAQAININDMGAQIQAGLGINVDNVTASEVVIVTMLIDDSGSIRFASNAQVVRDGHNLVIDALKKSKQSDGVLVMVRYLNGEILYSYCQLDKAVVMNSSNYNPTGGTPLYDETAVILATVLAKTQEFENSGVACRSVTLIVTDGADQHSHKQTPGKIKQVVSDMLKTENHIIAGMGIDDGTTDFRQVFQEMGIPNEWILTPNGSESEIRKAFQVFSQSAVRASQGAASFSQTAMGGFGN